VANACKDESKGEVPNPTKPVAASRQARVKYKSGARYANDLAAALDLPRDAICRELGLYDCVDEVHRIVLGGVEPYTLGVREPLPSIAVTAPIAQDRVALAACTERIGRDLAASEPVFLASIDVDAPTPGQLEVTARNFYDRILRREATPSELSALAQFHSTVTDEAGESGATATRDWAILSSSWSPPRSRASFIEESAVNKQTKRLKSSSRRSFLGRVAQIAAAGTSVSIGGLGVLGLGRDARAQDAEEEARARSADPRFLIVLTTTGGSSMLDAMLAIRESESANAATLNCFPDSVVRTVGPFRAVDIDLPTLGGIPMPVKGRQSAISRGASGRHDGGDLAKDEREPPRWSASRGEREQRMVRPDTARSRRAHLWRGVCSAERHLSAGTGFTERGSDASLPAYAYGETVADPRLWPLSLHGSQGILGAPSHGLLNQARVLRNTRLDPESRFGRVFAESSRLKTWQHLRGAPQQALEAQDLFTKLMISPDSAEFPLDAHGLSSSPDGELVRSAFPKFADDPLEAQAALAFLLLKYRLSVTVTLGPGSSAVVNGDGDEGDEDP
jgi:hypothetical protein